MRRNAVRPAALAVFVCTLYFAAALVVLNVVQGASYNAIEQAGSQLELGRAGGLLVVGFFALALGTLILAYVLGVTLGSFRALPVVLLAADGVIGLLPALFQTDGQNAAPSTHGLVHNLAGFITFLLYVAAMISCAFAFRSSSYWSRASRPAAAWAVAAICSFAVLLVLGGLKMFGLGERVALAAFLSWMLYVSWFAMRAGEVSPAEAPPGALADATG